MPLAKPRVVSMCYAMRHFIERGNCFIKNIGLALKTFGFCFLTHFQPYSRCFAKIASKHHCQSINQLRYSTTATTRPYLSAQERTTINGKTAESTNGNRKVIEAKSGKLNLFLA
jgi:hypothetical protein